MSDSSSPPSSGGLSESYDAGRATLRRLRRIQLGLSLGFAVVAVGFLVSLKARLESNFTPEAVGRSAEVELKKLTPKLQESATNVARNVGPKCMELGQARLEKTLPKLQIELDRELREFSDGLATNSEAKIVAALNRVRSEQLARLVGRVPALRDEEALRRAGDAWMQNVAEDSMVVLEQFQERALVDLGNLSHTLDGFDGSAYEGVECEQLLAYYGHLWISLLDAELLANAKMEVRDDG